MSLEELAQHKRRDDLVAAGMDEKHADLESHRIEGYIPSASQHVSIPLISQIRRNLWTGGSLPGLTLPDEFRYVVSLYPWGGHYNLPPGCSLIEIEMYDSDTIPDEGLLYALGDLVADLSTIGPTLVHCQAGVNRSALVGALALMAKGDYTPEEAIALLREKRSPIVLSNHHFEQWLLEQG